jgi:hypothetical protein
VLSFGKPKSRPGAADVLLFFAPEGATQCGSLIEIGAAFGQLRRETLEVRKTSLVTVLTGVGHGIWYNDHIEGDGQTVFRHACKLGLEGIVSKRKDSPYRSGRSPDWLKMKNPAHPAVKREEEDWAR